MATPGRKRKPETESRPLEETKRPRKQVDELSHVFGEHLPPVISHMAMLYTDAEHQCPYIGPKQCLKELTEIRDFDDFDELDDKSLFFKEPYSCQQWCFLQLAIAFCRLFRNRVSDHQWRQGDRCATGGG